MLRAITPIQVEELISVLDRLAEARKARAAQGYMQSSDEIIHDPLRRELIDLLYALSNEARDEMLLLMLAGRGGIDYDFTGGLTHAQSTTMRTIRSHTCSVRRYDSLSI